MASNGEDLVRTPSYRSAVSPVESTRINSAVHNTDEGADAAPPGPSAFVDGVPEATTDSGHVHADSAALGDPGRDASLLPPSSANTSGNTGFAAFPSDSQPNSHSSADAPFVNEAVGVVKDFLPPPGDRLVPELSSAELHQLRKDSEAVRRR